METSRDASQGRSRFEAESYSVDAGARKIRSLIFAYMRS
jgi:hypothetical protein